MDARTFIAIARLGLIPGAAAPAQSADSSRPVAPQPLSPTNAPAKN